MRDRGLRGGRMLKGFCKGKSCDSAKGNTQVLRDKIGTAMTNIKSRTDHTYMVRKGRRRRRSDPSRKRVQMYV